MLQIVHSNASAQQQRHCCCDSFQPYQPVCLRMSFTALTTCSMLPPASSRCNATANVYTPFRIKYLECTCSMGAVTDRGAYTQHLRALAGFGQQWCSRHAHNTRDMVVSSILKVSRSRLRQHPCACHPDAAGRARRSARGRASQQRGPPCCSSLQRSACHQLGRTRAPGLHGIRCSCPQPQATLEQPEVHVRAEQQRPQAPGTSVHLQWPRLGCSVAAGQASGGPLAHHFRLAQRRACAELRRLLSTAAPTLRPVGPRNSRGGLCIAGRVLEVRHTRGALVHAMLPQTPQRVRYIPWRM